MSVGKRYESELAKAFRAKHPEAFVERQPDKMIGKGKVSLPSPPDLLVNSRVGNYLIECKVVKGISVPLNRLSIHQHDYLMRYDLISQDHAGFVGLLYYNGQRGKGRVYDSWLVPILYWSNYIHRYPRKSLARKHVEGDLKKYRCTWVPGVGWELPAWA